MKLSERYNIKYDHSIERSSALTDEYARHGSSDKFMNIVITGFVFIIFTLITMTSCADVNPASKSGLAMDTVFSITVYGDRDMPGELLEAADQLDKSVLSRFSEGSLISRYTAEIYGESTLQINDYNGDGIIDDVDRTHAMSGYSATVCGKEYDLYDIFSQCEDIRYDSAGRFDVRIGALSDLWNIKGYMTAEDGPHIPVPAQIEAVKDDRSVLDLGSVGKGIYLDLAYDILSDSEASAAVISAGGSVLIYGQKPDGSDFKVAIRNPFSESSGDSFATIILSGTHFISTSGSYERYFEYNGEIYHHIIDPASGYPAWTYDDIMNSDYVSPEFRSNPITIPESIPVSVTIISDSGFLSDALSTACFVLGPEQGIPLAEKYSSEAIFIMNDGTVLTSRGIIFDEQSKTIEMAK
jgi:thiamine biosynthesis lipoprotein